MQIDTIMINPGPSIYYDDDFRRVLEDHLSLLKKDPSTSVLNIAPQKAYKYEFDLYGLLSDYNIQPQLHWLAMRLNGMTSPTDATKDITSLLIPDTNVVDRIRQSHMTTRRIS